MGLRELTRNPCTRKGGNTLNDDKLWEALEKLYEDVTPGLWTPGGEKMDYYITDATGINIVGTNTKSDAKFIAMFKNVFPLLRDARRARNG